MKALAHEAPVWVPVAEASTYIRPFETWTVSLAPCGVWATSVVVPIFVPPTISPSTTVAISSSAELQVSVVGLP